VFVLSKRGISVASDRITSIATSVLAVCALTMTGLVAAREFRHEGRNSPSQSNVHAVGTADWKELISAGHQMGSPRGPAILLEFADFQCPACAKLHTMLHELSAKHPNLVVIYRHYPLTQMHPLAYAAALESECAAAQARFEAYHDVLFDRQDSLSRLSPLDRAERAKVPDLVGFMSCVEHREFAERVERDIAVGNSAKLEATPLIYVNNQRIVGVPPIDVLDRMITDVERTAPPTSSKK
jgi:thiol-disulfide isomerase/thioredoxin